MDPEAGEVLIVDDDPQIRSVFSDYLEGSFTVRTAASGSGALEAVDEEVDVVLLDRRMPGMSGGEVLSSLREAGFEQPVAVVTAIEPDVDVLEMGFDDYVVKPVFEHELREIVETLLLRREYDDVIREYFALVSKVAALRQGSEAETLDGHDGFEDSMDRLEAIKAEARTALDVAIETGKFDELFHDVSAEEVEPGHLESEGPGDGSPP